MIDYSSKNFKLVKTTDAKSWLANDFTRDMRPVVLSAGSHFGRIVLCSGIFVVAS